MQATTYLPIIVFYGIDLVKLEKVLLLLININATNYFWIEFIDKEKPFEFDKIRQQT